MRRFLAAVLVWLALVPAAAAQDAATLAADQVYLTGTDRLIAEGNVAVFYRGARLTATRIVYDRSTDRLTIEGPITLTDGSGTAFFADAADLSRDLQDGILTSARMVMQDRLQIAANELRRDGGRYTRLTKVVASSCQVCPSNPRPLWEIRARSVVHDGEERQLYFDDAQLRVWGIPIFYLPTLRLPDPSVERATGFLTPRLRTTSKLGTGLKVPFFIAMGDSRDLTLTPYLSFGGTRTLEFRYREAFRTGDIVFDGAVSRDDLRPDETRGYLFGSGEFRLPRAFRLGFGLQLVSDPAYLLDYGVADEDQLESSVYLTRTRRNEHIDLKFYGYQTLRPTETQSTIPSFVADLSFHRRFGPRILGGEGGVRFEIAGLERTSATASDANGDGEVDGRDVARASLRLDWRRNWILPNGILAAGMFETTFDAYAISQDPAFPGTVTRVTPAAAVELRWPWVKSGARGVSHVIEPIVQVVWTPEDLDEVPNEDSRVVEFDDGNLFALNRFPGADAYERGLRANVGVAYTRVDPAGWSMGLVAGRVFRSEDLGQFTGGSGLDGRSSDWLVAAEVETAGGLTLTSRALFDDTFSFTRSELVVGWSAARYDLAGSYIWMVADPAEGRPTSTSELLVNAGWQISDGWRGTLDTRYDFIADRAARAGIGIEFSNECAVVDLSLSRRFTSSTSVRPSTDFNLSIELSGFGTRGDGRPYRKSCGG